MSFLSKKYKQNSFGLRERDMLYLRKEFFLHKNIEKVVIFGSRAMGNYKIGSDIDIAIFGKNIDSKLISKLNSVLNEELPIPFFIDLIHFASLKNKELREHILKEGKIIYKKQLEIND